MGKIEANELHVEHIPFLLAEVIDDASLFSIASRQKNVEFKTEISPGVNDLTLLGDRIRVRQVITNILSNAVKFTSAGTITFRVETKADSPDQTLLQFEVEDTGCGIEAAVIPLLFKPFQQADTSTARKYGGSGLGLMIAKNVRPSSHLVLVLTEVTAGRSDGRARQALVDFWRRDQDDGRAPVRKGSRLVPQPHQLLSRAPALLRGAGSGQEDPALRGQYSCR